MIKEKIESIIARLGRFTMEGGTGRDEDETKRKMILFEYVSSADHEPVPPVTL